MQRIMREKDPPVVNGEGRIPLNLTENFPTLGWIGKMPLEFDSLSHGRIAFGFFNIETDLLLLNQYFFFAEDFCHAVAKVAEKMDEVYRTAWEGYQIEFEKIGNLMGAIHGIDARGFIGAVYRYFPFPERQEDFKQNPEGFQTRPLMDSLLQTYGEKVLLPLTLDQKRDKIILSEFIFDRPSFYKLVEYVWLGGLPRWRDRRRPQYVMAMKEALERAQHPMLKGQLFIEKDPP